ncbi:hypothetical protein LSAT2_010552 [Lamellibrachia satsuma]|nr:hypothetical protein LSAT2_010552 [Lamellibrachia satsuma]
MGLDWPLAPKTSNKHHQASADMESSRQTEKRTTKKHVATGPPGRHQEDGLHLEPVREDGPGQGTGDLLSTAYAPRGAMGISIDRIFNDIKEMIGSKPGPYFYYTWKFIAPALISAILISQFVAFETLTYGDYMYPLWADVLGWVVVALEFALIPGVAFYKVYSAKDDLPLLERIRSLCRPTRDWGQRLDISNGELPPDDDSNQMGTNVVQTESMNVLKHNSGLLQPGVNPMEETEAAAEMFVTGQENPAGSSNNDAYHFRPIFVHDLGSSNNDAYHFRPIFVHDLGSSNNDAYHFRPIFVHDLGSSNNDAYHFRPIFVHDLGSSNNDAYHFRPIFVHDLGSSNNDAYHFRPIFVHDLGSSNNDAYQFRPIFVHDLGSSNNDAYHFRPIFVHDFGSSNNDAYHFRPIFVNDLCYVANASERGGIKLGRIKQLFNNSFLWHT